MKTGGDDFWTVALRGAMRKCTKNKVKKPQIQAETVLGTFVSDSTMVVGTEQSEKREPHWGSLKSAVSRCSRTGEARWSGMDNNEWLTQA